MKKKCTESFAHPDRIIPELDAPTILDPAEGWGYDQKMKFVKVTPPTTMYPPRIIPPLQHFSSPEKILLGRGIVRRGVIIFPSACWCRVPRKNGGFRLPAPHFRETQKCMRFGTGFFWFSGTLFWRGEQLVGDHVI